MARPGDKKKAVCLFLVAVWASFPVPARAAIEEESYLISFDFGAGIPKTEVESGFGSAVAGKMGPGVGATWIYHVTAPVGFGGRVLFLPFGKNASAGSGGVNLNCNASQLLIQMMGRYVFHPETSSYPYLITGAGISQYKVHIKGIPGGAFSWPGTQLTETRDLVDRDFLGFAFTFGVGYEFPMGKASRGSFDLMWNDSQVESAVQHKGYSLSLLFHWGLAYE